MDPLNHGQYSDLGVIYRDLGVSNSLKKNYCEVDMSIYQKVNQTKIVKTLFCIHFPEGCLSLTASMVKRCMHFLRQLKIVGISQNILKLFYYAVKEHILTFSITVVWLRPLEEKAQLEVRIQNNRAYIANH